MFNLEFIINFCGPPEPPAKNVWYSKGVYWHAKDEQAARIIGGQDYLKYHSKYK
jgi:hypothetical protein